jgi:hypothetical protein
VKIVLSVHESYHRIVDATCGEADKLAFKSPARNGQQDKTASRTRRPAVELGKKPWSRLAALGGSRL